MGTSRDYRRSVCREQAPTRVGGGPLQPVEPAARGVGSRPVHVGAFDVWSFAKMERSHFIDVADAVAHRPLLRSAMADTFEWNVSEEEWTCPCFFAQNRAMGTSCRHAASKP